jgi:hypothetical protein
MKILSLAGQRNTAHTAHGTRHTAHSTQHTAHSTTMATIQTTTVTVYKRCITLPADAPLSEYYEHIRGFNAQNMNYFKEKFNTDIFFGVDNMILSSTSGTDVHAAHLNLLTLISSLEYLKLTGPLELGRMMARGQVYVFVDYTNLNCTANTALCGGISYAPVLEPEHLLQIVAGGRYIQGLAVIGTVPEEFHDAESSLWNACGKTLKKFYRDELDEWTDCGPIKHRSIRLQKGTGQREFGVDDALAAAMLKYSHGLKQNPDRPATPIIILITDDGNDMVNDGLSAGPWLTLLDATKNLVEDGFNVQQYGIKSNHSYRRELREHSNFEQKRLGSGILREATPSSEVEDIVRMTRPLVLADFISNARTARTTRTTTRAGGDSI